MQKSTTQRTALITGGASGIGLAIAKKMLKEQVQVMVADLHQPQEVMPTGLHFHQCDVTDGKQVDNLYITAKENHGLPDILVCNAGRGLHEKLTEGDPQKWQQTLEVNVMGALRCIRSFVPDMLRNGYGDVVFISSVSAGQAYPYGGIYAASKAALEVIAETLRLEVRPMVRVLVVAPGAINTPFFENMLSGQQSLDQLDLEAIGANEVADSVWYGISKSRETTINKIIIRPAGQAF